jgi:hypothetical protein
VSRRVVIWGYKTHKTRHTNSYVFYGYHRAFVHLGFETLWLDDDDDVSNISFDDCIFLSEGQVDSKIPLRKTAKYVIHSANDVKYAGFDKTNLQIFHNTIAGPPPRESHPTFNTNDPLTKINDYTFVTKTTIYQPWATDLLPHEIDVNSAHNEMDRKTCVWIGSYGDRTTEYQNTIQLDAFFKECKRHGVSVSIVNPWSAPVSPEENRRLVHNSYLAPSIQGPWQIRYGYAPQCRIMKNISYGHMGITNHEFLNQLFGGRLVYDPDPARLFHKAVERKHSDTIISDIQDLMKYVQENHTFVNRVNVILSVLGVT